MFIKKLYNNIDTVVEESMAGTHLLFPGAAEVLPGTRITVRKPDFRKPKGLVKIAGGGGAGHEGPGPSRVGPGGYDMAISGDVFAAPSAAQIFKALSIIDDGSPIFLGVTNHLGDILNFGLATKMARSKGIDVHMHVIYNDVASAPKGREKERRAIIGAYNLVSIMAECGEPIEEILRVAEKTNLYTRAYGVGLRSAIHPVTGLPIMEMPETKIELGIGVHGESSGKQIELPRSKDLAVIVCDILLDDMPIEKGEEIYVSLNGLGGMTWMELNIFFKDVYEYLTGKGIKIYLSRGGNNGTQELGGFILAIARVDDEIKKWLNAKYPQDRYIKS